MADQLQLIKRAGEYLFVVAVPLTARLAAAVQVLLVAPAEEVLVPHQLFHHLPVVAVALVVVRDVLIRIAEVTDSG